MEEGELEDLAGVGGVLVPTPEPVRPMVYTATPAAREIAARVAGAVVLVEPAPAQAQERAATVGQRFRIISPARHKI